jgi:hypothetical protein
MDKLFFWRKSRPASPERDAATEQVVGWFRERYVRLGAEQRDIIRTGLAPQGQIKVTKAATVCKALGMFNKEV